MGERGHKDPLFDNKDKASLKGTGEGQLRIGDEVPAVPTSAEQPLEDDVVPANAPIATPDQIESADHYADTDSVDRATALQRRTSRGAAAREIGVIEARRFVDRIAAGKQQRKDQETAREVDRAAESLEALRGTFTDLDTTEGPKAA